MGWFPYHPFGEGDHKGPQAGGPGSDCSRLPAFASAIHSGEGAQAPRSQLLMCCNFRAASKRKIKSRTWNFSSLLVPANGLLPEHFCSSSLTPGSVSIHRRIYGDGEGPAYRSDVYWRERQQHTERNAHGAERHKDRERTEEVPELAGVSICKQWSDPALTARSFTIMCTE